MPDVHSSPPAPIRVLVVDDNPTDTELIGAELHRAKLVFSLEHAADQAEFLAKLAKAPDVVLTDFTMPGFSGMEVLRLVLERRADLPVIIVSGSIGEEQAVTAMKEGAFDYLLKDRLARLGQAVQRAVAHRKLRAAHREAEETNARLISIIEGSPDLVAITDEQDRLLFLNEAGHRLTGIPPAALARGVQLDEFLLPGGDGSTPPPELPAAERPPVQQGEMRLKLAHGGSLPVAVTMMRHAATEGRSAYHSVVTRNLREWKEAETRIAALLRISRKLNSTLDQGTLLDELVRESIALLTAEAGCAGVRVGDELQCHSYHTRQSRTIFEHRWPAGQGLPGWVLEHKAPYLSNDVRRDPQSSPALDLHFDVHRALCLPILDSRGEVIGFFEIHNKLSGDFDMADVELMRGVAQSAALALGNALAYQQTEDARRELSRYAAGLNEVVELQQRMNAPEQEMAELPGAMLTRLGQLVEADGAVIELREGDEMVYRAATGTAAGQLGLRLRIDGSFSGLCLRQNRSLVCEDTEADSRVDLAACRKAGVRSMIGIPFFPSPEASGVLKVYSAQPRRFGETDRRLLEILSGALASVWRRKQAENQLVQKERDFRALFAANPVPMWVLDATTSRFLAVNEAAVRNYGYTRQEFLALDLSRISPAEETPGVPAAVRWKGAGPDQGIHRHCRKDGSELLVKVTSDALDFEGRPARLMLAYDVTREKVAERRIAEQARLIDLSPDAVIVCDLSSVVRFWSTGAERVYGVKSEDATGRRITDCFQPDHAAIEKATVLVLAHGEWAGEFRECRKDGREITLACRWTLVRDEHGQPQSVLAIKSDVTEQKKLESQFLRAQRMESIGSLAAGIAHDLNNILAPILMGSGLLARIANDPKLVTLAETIRSSAQRGADIVKQVLVFSRGSQGERTPLQLRNLIRDMENLISDTFPKNITCKTEVDADLWLVEADSTQMHQVLLNLCVNARDAMTSGGLLRLVAKNVEVDGVRAAQSPQLASGRYVCLEVIDTGTGIPREIIGQIFDPFFSTKAPGKGTGLGLSTVQAIIKAHGGMICVYSEPGIGTTFRINLPAAKVDAVVPQSVMSAMPRGNGEGVLIVDDESAVRTIARQTLEAFGYRVFDANNGAEAVGILVQHRHAVHIVVTDMMMPIMDGAATIQAVRQIAPALPIVASSGLDVDGHLARATSAGVRHILTKPFDAPTLLNVIHDALHKQPAGR